MTTFGKYQVIDLIGEGGFGKVYRGQDPVLKRPVAIKTCTLLQGDMRERFVREAEIAANLRHPNILTVYDFGEENGEPYLVQEYLPGEDLNEKILRSDLIPLATKVEWLRQVAQGLRFAHENGVVHRDVKPANIRVLPDGQVRIMDFGIAKLLQADRQLTQMGFSVGTTGYLAPEQLRGEEVDHRADIFAFGVLAYELITYRRPFEAETITAILYRIANVDPQPLVEAVPGCPPRLAACIERCLHKNREERWSSLALVIEELDAVAREIGAIGAAAVEVGATNAFAVVTGSGPTRIDPAAAVPGSAAPAGGPRRERTAPRDEEATPAPDHGRFWRRRSPALLGLAAATIGVALFGVFNVARWAEPSSPRDASDRDVVQPDPAPAFDEPADISPGAIDEQDRANARAQAASGSTDTTDARSPGGGAGAPSAAQLDSPGAPPGGAATTAGRSGASGAGRQPERSPAGAIPVQPPAAPAALPAGSVLVLMGGGPEVARGVAESTLIAELLRGGFAPVEDETSASMAQRARDIRGLGQRNATGTVLISDLRALASPGVGRFFTGTATLTLRAYDANTGQLLGTESFQVGAGGVPGKSAATEDAAVTEAARAVAFQASRYAAGLIVRRE